MPPGGKPRPTRLLVKHRPRCDAVLAWKAGAWPTPWATVMRRQMLNQWGTLTREQRYPWFVFRCQDQACPALMGVRAEWILAKVKEERRGRDA